MFDMKQIGLEIAALRRRQNETQRQTASAIGISQSFLGFMELGERIPMIPVLERLAEHLGGELVVEIRRTRAARTPPTPEEQADTAFMAEVARLIPNVRDDVERRVILRDLQRAAEREAERRTARG